MSESTGISVGGLASGLDTNAIIDGLVGLEAQKVKRVEIDKENNDLRLSTWGQLVTRLSDLKSKSEELNKSEKFDKFKLTSTDEDIVTLKGRDGGAPGTYSVSVFQLAQSEKILSNTYAAQNTALGVAGEFTVNRTRAAIETDPTLGDVTITIDAGETLKDIRDKINSNAEIGISASIVKLSATQYSLVFTSKDTGAAGATYTETVGTVLRDLGILDATGSKGNVAHQAQSAANTEGGADITAATLFSAVDGAGSAINDTITIQGLDHNGNALAPRNFIITDPSTVTVGDFLSEIEAAFNGTVTATVENGRIVVTDRTSGRSALQVQLTANNEGGGALSLGGLLSVKTAGKSGVLQVGHDAFLSVDGIYLSDDSNEVDDTVEGITLELNRADIDKSVQVSLARDFDAIAANVQLYLDAFNAVTSFIDEKTKVKVKAKDENQTTDEEKKDAVEQQALAGDTSVLRLRTDLRNMLSGQQSELSGFTYDSLASVGIIFDRLSLKYTVDTDKFKSALARDYDSVKRLFVEKGSSEDANFIFGRATERTKSGRYLVDVDARTVSVLDANDAVVKTYNADYNAIAGVMTVNEKGDAKGLSITVPATGSAILTFSKGVTQSIADYVEIATDKYDGFVTQRQKTIQDKIDELGLKITSLGLKVEDYRARLVKQFSDLEQNLSRLQGQSAQMMSQLGMR